MFGLDAGLAAVAGQGAGFAVDSAAVDPALFGLVSYSGDPVAPVGRIGRASAIQCPAVKRARDAIAGTLGGIPMVMLDGSNQRQDSPLLSQPESNLARSITMTRTYEDLLFEGVAWWRITSADYRGYPQKVARLDPRSVDQRQDAKTYVSRAGTPQGTVWEYVPDDQLIRFDSPNDPLLVAGARAIRTLLKLDAAASRYSEEPMPSGYFSPADDADAVDDDDVQELLDNWASARTKRSTAYIPAALKYEVLQWNPEQLQLSQARQHAVLEIARATGIDPEDLGVSTTTRTYQNGVDRRQARINDVLGPYASAVADRLSMADVTPRGYRVDADYSGFLRADDATRFATYQQGVDLGLFTVADVAAREGLPAPAQAAPATTTTRPAPLRVVAHQEKALTATSFDASPGIFGFDTEETRTAFEVDAGDRTIFGLAVPYGVPASKAGQQYQFSQGTLKWSDPGRVKLLMAHDRTQAIGKAIELTDAPEGLWAKFKVARGAEGDRALSLAEDGVWDGLSIGLADGGTFSKRGGVAHSVSADLAEISLTPTPAFSDARVSAVAAESDQQEGTADMGDQITESPQTAPAFDMDALAASIAQKLTPARETITPAGGPLFVAEELPYRFDAGQSMFVPGGAHDFSSDLIAGSRGDAEAMARANEFVRLAFAVSTTDVTTLNPVRQRPDLYVDQRAYLYPLWNAVNSGTLTDNTPFTFPKFASSSGLVAPHTQGVEPTPGSFTATSQTVTPAPVSGKVEITREVFDQGGNPQVSNLIWQKMTRAYYEALEARVVALLDAATPTGITISTAAHDAALQAQLVAAFVQLQYIRGGFAFDQFAVQTDLFQSLAGAVDSAGRSLFPILGPTNALGTAQPRYSSLDVAGVKAYPSWALAATGTTPASSYLFDSSSVHAWASAPQRLQFEYRVAYVDLAIWGYVATAISDLSGVREVIYDPAA